MTDFDRRLERLKDEARDRWGERWVVKVSHFADGDRRAHAIRSRGQNNSGHLVKDQLFMLENGEMSVQRVTVEHNEIDSKVIELPESAAEHHAAIHSTEK